MNKPEAPPKLSFGAILTGHINDAGPPTVDFCLSKIYSCPAAKPARGNQPVVFRDLKIETYVSDPGFAERYEAEQEQWYARPNPLRPCKDTAVFLL
jgi:hypothetical protein